MMHHCVRLWPEKSRKTKQGRSKTRALLWQTGLFKWGNRPTCYGWRPAAVRGYWHIHWVSVVALRCWTWHFWIKAGQPSLLNIYLTCINIRTQNLIIKENVDMKMNVKCLFISCCYSAFLFSAVLFALCRPGGAAGGTAEAAAGPSSSLLPAACQEQNSHQAPDQTASSAEARLHNHPPGVPH